VEYFATGHAKQVADAVAAFVIEYFPAPHLVQMAVPEVGLKVPATQSVHVPPTRSV
jgi:hypothetical protein